ncbi:MAG: Type 1 glutamine amidotransferase-like domain-containing protein [Dermatophilaceae bacterium]
MTVFLVGGGVSDHLSSVYDRFASEVHLHAQGTDAPRVLVVILGSEASARTYLPAYAELVTDRIVAEVETLSLGPDAPASLNLDGLGGVIVGGGRTMGYLEGLLPLRDALQGLVRKGVPYLGFSAGAMVASQVVICGGYRWNGTQVCPSEAGDGMTDVELREGLGLVDLTVETHASAMGTLGRAVVAVESRRTSNCVALDEDTALAMESDGTIRTVGSGSAWWVTRADDVISIRPQSRVGGPSCWWTVVGVPQRSEGKGGTDTAGPG